MTNTLISPSISYKCPCSLSSASSAALPISPSCFPLSHLYFCPDCCEIKCPRCVQTEIICYFCPNCLFEVPSASVKSEKNRCARNCFCCPVCSSTVQVIGTEGSRSSSLSSLVSPATSSGASYHLSCPFCRWDSRNIGVAFDKPTGLGAMMMKKDDNTPLALEHANLKSHYTQSSTPTTTRPSHLSILSLSTLSFQSRFSSFNRPGLRDKENDKKEPYKSIRTWGGMEAELEREKELVEKMKGLVGVEEVSTINQRLAQPLKQAHLSANLEPMRTHLRTKLSKRCRSCEHILVKPEQKAQVTRFKIKMIAMSYLPEITILQPTPTLVQNETCKIKLKFTNPLEEDNTVHLFIPLATLQNQVKASCSRFTIPAYNEMAQYEEPAQPRRGGIQKSGTADSKNAGAVEVKGNSVVVELEVIPKGPLGNIVEFPLYITSSAITPSSQSSSVTDLSTASQVGKLKEGIQVPPSTPMESTGNLFDIDASNKDAKLTDKEALVKSGGELEGSGGKGLTVEVIVRLGTVISKMDTSK